MPVASQLIDQVTAHAQSDILSDAQDIYEDGSYFPNNLRTLSVNKVRELIAVKVLHTSLLNATVVAFKVLPLGSYAPAPSPPFTTILELVLWNILQSCRCITPDVINVIKMPSFQCFLYLREQKKKVIGGLSR